MSKLCNVGTHRTWNIECTLCRSITGGENRKNGLGVGGGKGTNKGEYFKSFENRSNRALDIE